MAPTGWLRQSRTSRAPTATALARYQKTSSLLLSQSQGWNLTRLAARNTRLKGAISSRARPRSASGLSSATRRSGIKSPVFLIQNHGGMSAPDIQPINQRGYWWSGGAPGSPGTAISRRGTASSSMTPKNPIHAGRGKRSAQQAVTTPRTTRLWTWISGSSPVSAPAIRKATASFLIAHRRHDCRTAEKVARQSKNGVCSQGGGDSRSTPPTTAGPRKDTPPGGEE